MSNGLARVAIASRQPSLVKSGSWIAQKRRAFLVGLVPALVVLAAITIAPALYLLVVSLTPLNLTMPQTAWNFSRPLDNYLQLPADERFVNSVWVQVKLSVLTVGLQLLAGLAVALILNTHSRFIEAVRTTFLVPMVLPPIVVASIWKVLYTPDVSPIYRLLATVGLRPGAMITSPDYALWGIVIADVW